MTLQPPGGKTITRFLNSDCNAFNESCFIYNLTRPGYASNNDPVNVTVSTLSRTGCTRLAFARNFHDP